MRSRFLVQETNMAAGHVCEVTIVAWVGMLDSMLLVQFHCYSNSNILTQVK